MNNYLSEIAAFCTMHPVFALLIGVIGFPEVEIIIALIALIIIATK